MPFFRAYINTYISLLAATVCTFVASAIFGSARRFQAVDVQNATLAGNNNANKCPFFRTNDSRIHDKTK